ncbi:hypothetical protein ACQY0O_002577 [Thecaphora frezii]
MFWSTSSSKASTPEAAAPSAAPSSSISSSASSASSSLDGATSSSSSADAGASSSGAAWTPNGPAGLGVISSMSPECTPLKHRYDSCFDKWFTDYLAIGDAQILDQQRQGSGAASSPEPAASTAAPRKKKSWFGGSDDGGHEPAAASAPSAPGLFASGGGQQADPELERRKRKVMERYDRDCGKLFKEYRGCVKRAATAKGLDALIEGARAENPFPFDHQRQDDGRGNNPPFPFPAAHRS